MIDIESLVFDTVYNQLNQQFSTIYVTAGFDERKASYPSVIVRETGNVPYQRGNTDSCAENFTTVTYEIEVISNKCDMGRSECKKILSAVDDIMTGMKFRRIYKSNPSNINRSAFNQFARYEAIVGKGVTTVTGTGNEVVSTTTFQMYRR